MYALGVWERLKQKGYRLSQYDLDIGGNFQKEKYCFSSDEIIS